MRKSSLAGRLTGWTPQAKSTLPPEAVITRTLAILVVALSIGGAAIHLAAAPEHLAELGLLGFGFPISAALQAGFAGAWWFRPATGVAWFGIVLNAAIASAWTGSRLFGLPAGDSPWSAEPAGTPDVMATVFELIVVALLVARLTGRDVALARRPRVLAGAVTAAIVPVVGVIFLATLLAVGVAAGGDHHAMDHSHSDAGPEMSHAGG